MPTIVTILLSVISLLLGIISFFLIRDYKKRDEGEKKLEELAKSNVEMAKEFIKIQLLWDNVRDDWEAMKSVILLLKK